MSRNKKAIIICLIMLLVCAVMTSCGISEAEAIGTWSCAYTYNGNDFDSAFQLSEDGTYVKIVMKNGSLSSTETGEYEVKGNKVILYDSSAMTYHGKSMEFKYKDGVLINADHEFEKVN